jgi:hypothetical protein
MGQHCDGVARIDRTLALVVCKVIPMEGINPMEKRLASGATFRIMCSISDSASTNKYKGANALRSECDPKQEC